MGGPSPLIAQTTSDLAGFLIVETGSLTGHKVLLPAVATSLTLGRERSCNIQFDSQRELLVGRTHARIEVRQSGVFLVDLNSANGTFRNGVAVVGEVQLQHGDRLQLGGEGGPCLAVHFPVAVPVHIRPQPEVATLIMRAAVAGPLGPAAGPRPEAPILPPSPAVAPSVKPIHEAEATPAAIPIWAGNREPARAAVSTPAEPVISRQRAQVVRQVLLVIALLIAASIVGLTVGLSSDGENVDPVSTP